MEDEHRETLKKKIQILFQLGKFPDVAKLCATYREKYGQDPEIDQIRFKSDRHMGVASAPPQPAAPAGMPPAAANDASIPLLSPDDQSKLDDFAQKVPPRPAEPDIEELDIGDPFAADDLAVEDPFAQEAGGLRLAPEQPPVILSEPGREDEDPEPPLAPEPKPAMVKEAHPDDEVAGSGDAELELDEPLASSPGLQLEGGEPDFSDLGGMTLDAEPELIPASPPPPAAPGPRDEAAPAPREVAPPESPPASVGPTLYPGTEERPKPASRPAPEQQPLREERPRPQGSMFAPPAAREAPSPRKSFPLKTLLLVAVPLLLAAAAAWLVLGGKSGPAQPSEPAAQPQAALPRPRPRPQPSAAAPATAVKPEAPEAISQEALKDKAFAEKLQQAENLLRLGDLASAQAALQEAERIKTSDALKRLQAELTAKAAAARQEPLPVRSEQEREYEALAKARASNTIAAWREFMGAFPQSESLPLAQARIAALERKAQDEAQQLLLQRIRRERQAVLRSQYLNLGQAELATLAAPAAKPSSRFEPHVHGNASVTLDLATGLMWTLYNRPMTLDKARWWANRISAGYSGWRLPTVEEALTLRQMDRGQYAGLAGFAVWTGDGVVDQPRSAWALQLPESRFLPKRSDEACYVWSVRQAVK